MRPADIVSLASCIHRLGYTPSAPWLAAWCDASRAVMAQLGPRDLADLAVALTELAARHKAGPGAAVATGAGQDQVPVAGPAHQDEQHEHQAQHFVLPASWTSALLNETRSKLDRFTGPALAGVMGAAAQAKLRPGEPWLRSAASAVLSKAGALGPSDLAALLVALTDLGLSAQAGGPHSTVPSGHTTSSVYADLGSAEVAQLLVEVRAKMSMFDDIQLARVAGALAGFGAQPDAEWGKVGWVEGEWVC